MSNGSDERTRDLVLAPGQQAFLHDITSGNVRVLVGPIKVAMGENNQPVLFEPNSGTFRKCALDEAIFRIVEATEEQYIVLHNPAEGGAPHPGVGAEAVQVKLHHGKVVVIHGPESFALWPGQFAMVVPGHTLRLHEFIVAEVYNEEEARTNWGQSVQKPQTPAPPPPDQSSDEPGAEGEPSDEPGAGDEITPEPEVPEAEISVRTAGTLAGIDPDKLVTGQRIVIPGTETSFFMPCTGVRVLRAKGTTTPDDRSMRDESSSAVRTASQADSGYVQQAVTLEYKEYCILRDQKGTTRYVEGPAVVFPSPTEEFVEREGGERIFKAFELNPNSGVYVKAIADYESSDGQIVKAGTELFITGDDQPFYIPRPEHMMIRYGNQYVHFAIAIPAGEGRYVLNRDTGEVGLITGPKMFLPDPRTEVVVRRVLDADLVKLLYPGNTEALELNLALRRVQEATGRFDVDYIMEERGRGQRKGLALDEEPVTRGLLAAPAQPWAQEPDFAGSATERRTVFTPPRTVTLDTKYDGAVMIDVWRGYAVSIVSKTGDRRVVVGPETVLLQYGETVETFELLTGRPKKEPVKRDVYLRVSNNTVTDQVEAETSDLCEVLITLVLRVNFEGDNPESWFAVENYIKLLVDHIRSIVRGVVKQHDIRTFYAQSTAILRDAILQVAQEGQPRPGRAFSENNMRVYDVEVLEVEICDSQVADMLLNAQREAFAQTIEQQRAERLRDGQLAKIGIEGELTDAQHEAYMHQIELEETKGRAAHEHTVAANERSKTEAAGRLEATKATEAIEDFVAGAKLARDQAEAEHEQGVATAEADLRIKELQARAEAFLKRAGALAPEIVAALQHFADAELAGRAAEAMAPLAILGGKSVVQVLSQLLQGTDLASAVQALGSKGDTGQEDTGVDYTGEDD